MLLIEVLDRYSTALKGISEEPSAVSVRVLAIVRESNGTKITYAKELRYRFEL
jgi:hypothetical protein